MYWFGWHGAKINEIHLPPAQERGLLRLNLFVLGILKENPIDAPFWIKWLELITFLFCLVGVIIHVKFVTKENHRRARVYIYLIYRRVRETSFPIHQFSANRLLAGLNVLYGETWGRRVATSIGLSLIYTIMAINIGLWWSPWVFTAESEKTRIEKAIDPELFGLSQAERWAAFDEDYIETTTIIGQDGKPEMTFHFTYDDIKYKKIRDQAESFTQKYRNVFDEHPQRDAIAILTLLRGTHVSPGFQLGSVFSLVLFNSVIDLIAYLGIIALLSRLALTRSLWAFAAESLMGLLGAAMLFFLTLLPYGNFVSGDTYVFSVMMFYIPFGIFFFLVGVFSIVYPFIEYVAEDRWVLGLCGPFEIGIGGWIIVSNWNRILFTGLPNFYVASGGVNWIPYLLAASTIVLVMVCLVTILAVLTLKVFGKTVHAAFQTYLEVMVKLKQPVIITIFALPAALLQFFSRVYPLLN